MRKKRTFEPHETEYVDPLTGRQPWKQSRDLGWTDILGRRWDKLSDICTKPGYADPDPLPRRRKQIKE
jgi:hypothetical protein